MSYKTLAKEALGINIHHDNKGGQGLLSIGYKAGVTIPSRLVPS